MRILVVEDDAAILAMVADILTDEGHTVSVAFGEKPIAPLVHQYAPDVILLDLRLPLTSGEAVLESLWEDEKLRSVPVILSSVWHRRLAEVYRVAQERGQTVYRLPKPYGFTGLLRAIDLVSKDCDRWRAG